MKRHLSILLIAALLLFALAGCTSTEVQNFSDDEAAAENVYANALTAYPSDKQVATINDTPVYWNEYAYDLANIASQVASYSGTDSMDWSAVYDEESCVGEVAGNDYAGLFTQLLRLDQDGGNIRAVGRRAHMAIAGFLTDGQRRSARTGVRDELIGAVRAGQAHGRETVQVQLAVVHHPGATDLLQAHAVADHDDDVPHLVVHGWHGHIHDFVRIGRGVILEDFLFLLVLAGNGQQGGGQGDQGNLFHVTFRK